MDVVTCDSMTPTLRARNRRPFFVILGHVLHVSLEVFIDSIQEDVRLVGFHINSPHMSAQIVRWLGFQWDGPDSLRHISFRTPSDLEIFSASTMFCFSAMDG